MLDPAMLAAGHANPRTGEIGIQKPWCGTLMSYLAHPARATDLEIQSLNIFTHESMHVRGEIERGIDRVRGRAAHYRAAKLLGVS